MIVMVGDYYLDIADNHDTTALQNDSAKGSGKPTQSCSRPIWRTSTDSRGAGTRWIKEKLALEVDFDPKLWQRCVISKCPYLWKIDTVIFNADDWACCNDIFCRHNHHTHEHYHHLITIIIIWLRWHCRDMCGHGQRRLLWCTIPILARFDLAFESQG